MTNHSDIKFNSGELYFYLHAEIADDDSFDSFCKYLSGLKHNPVRLEIANILYLVSRILKLGKQDEKLAKLPQIFCDEPWRGQKLIQEIIINKIDSMAGIAKEVDWWATAEEKYL